MLEKVSTASSESVGNVKKIASGSTIKDTVPKVSKVRLNNAQKTRIGHAQKDADAAVKEVRELLSDSPELTPEQVNAAAKVKKDDNQTEMKAITDGVDKATASRLKSIITRIERLEEEKTALNEDIKEVFGEAKSTGFNTQIIRQIIKLRKIELDKRRESEMLLDTYKAAIGME